MYTRFFNKIGKKGRICSVYRSGRKDIPYICETGEDKDHFYDLTKQEQALAEKWLVNNLFSADTPLSGHTSYGMKHVLEKRTNIYMTNNQFKELMICCGFLPVEVDELNWRFKLKAKSPIFTMFPDGKDGIPLLGNPIDYRKSQV